MICSLQCGKVDVSKCESPPPRTRGSVRRAQQRFQIGERIQAPLMALVVAQLAGDVLGTFQIGLGQFQQKAARFAVLDFAEFLPGLGVTERQGLPCPRDCHVGQTTFFFDAFSITRLMVREAFLLEAAKVNVIVFESPWRHESW